jgi:acetylornithine deacetylase
LGTVDEENGCKGARALMKEELRAEAAIVGEPTNLDLVIAHTGCLRWRIKTKGKACHSSQPQKGKNAIYKMNKIISLIENVCRLECERLRHPLTGKAAISVGTIQGGVQINIIPDSCIIEIDRRTLPYEKPGEIIEQFNSHLLKLKKEDPELEVELLDIQENLHLETNKEEKIVQVMQAACRSRLKQCNLRGAGWFSNAGEFFHKGIPSIVFGPGSIEQAHSANEYIEIDQVVKASEILVETIKNFHTEKETENRR